MSSTEQARKKNIYKDITISFWAGNMISYEVFFSFGLNAEITQKKIFVTKYQLFVE